MNDKPAGDEHMGAWVYCKEHVNAHSTGWCTVGPDRKVALKATTYDEAMAEVRENGWSVYGDD